MYLPEIKFCAWVIWENHVKLLIMWKVHTHVSTQRLSLCLHIQEYFLKENAENWVYLLEFSHFFALVFTFFSWVWVLLEGFSFKMLICKPDPESVEFGFFWLDQILMAPLLYEREEKRAA